MNHTQTAEHFSSLGIQEPFLSILNQNKIVTPTLIQQEAIPVVLQGEDLIGIAQTGTGKTLAFVLPLIQNMQHHQGTLLIVAPTRELAFQISEVCQQFAAPLKLSGAVVIGGASMHKQQVALRRQPRVIIATPGRLIDHLRQGTMKLGHVTTLVLDEADQMFDMGFAPQIKTILEQLPPRDKRQTLLFSATMPDPIVRIVNQHMRSPLRVEIARSGTTAEGIRQEMIVIDKEHQNQALHAVLQEVTGSVLIFTRTKSRAKRLTEMLSRDYKVEELHGNRSLGQRRAAMAAIQSKRSQILVATDIAARGIDIEHLETVINYDLPDNAEDYIHRIGRTGRAGKTGRAISFVLSDQGAALRQIQRLINTQIEQISIDSVPTAQLYGGGGGGSRPRSRSRAPRSGGFRRMRRR